MRAEHGFEGWEPCGAAVSWPVIAPHLPGMRSLPAALPPRTAEARFVAEYRGRQSPCYGAPRQMPQNNIEKDLLRTVTRFHTMSHRSSTVTLISIFGAWSQRHDNQAGNRSPAKRTSNLDGHLICQIGDDRWPHTRLDRNSIPAPQNTPHARLIPFCTTLIRFVVLSRAGDAAAKRAGPPNKP